MRILYVGLLFVLTFPVSAQIGVGTTTPNAAAVLDVNSSNRGFLMPRIALTSATDATTITSPAKGLIVYNKGTGGFTPEGLYQWNGTGWRPVVYEAANYFSGDVNGNTGANKVVGIRTKPIVFSSPSATQLLRFNGTSWVNSNDVSSQNWLMTGNTVTTVSNFLGTTDDVKMTLSSYSQPFFEFGRRQTLGLTQGYTDYTNDNQLVTHLRSAIQFEAPGASFYKPMFFVDGYGNFRFKGSAAGNDYFEIGAAGSTSNDGSVEFIVGDDGNEPVVFEKYNNTTKVELMRMQGTGLNTEVRVGINTNYTTANSVLQVRGSQARSIVSTNASITLSDVHHTVVFTGGDASIAVSLPAANLVTGRTYVIRNTSGSTKIISTYINQSGTSVTSIANNSVIWLQSDGTNWMSI
ncbi:hypothetical protein NAT51_04220 [Flavobacterium amniphilum]|uniref:hypothetical protein n=1 Tax=Flavobacterium amniphilum TaxID=1834035 RepID=UPI00202A0996|nr:hypothetical protein [Flavobacterium amniphilum]MCL9804714.1 hypothetical protein [Flavobacterium amniphilum]